MTLLIETTGIYADTGRLCAVLDRFASDHLAAVWNLHDPCVLQARRPIKRSRTLALNVRHVHIRDSRDGERRTVYRMVGDGSLPIGELLLALRSIDYNGHMTLDMAGDGAELTEQRDVLPYFVSMMNRITGKNDPTVGCYENRAGTGKFIWQKDVLLEMTFSQVLDRLVDVFPNQYAFRYTTLDYTRTYEEFREDVDTFASPSSPWA